MQHSTIREPRTGDRSGEPGDRWRRRLTPVLEDRGSATAEYAIATMAAVGFAGLLVVILRGDEVRSALAEIIHRALTVGS